jgi:integrase
MPHVEKLTDAALKSALRSRPEMGAEPLKVRCRSMRGFYAAISATNCRFYFQHRNKRINLGSYPETTLPRARDAALLVAAQERSGIAKFLPTRESSKTVGQMLEDYVGQDHLRSEQWKRCVRDYVEHDLRWYTMPASSISRDDIRVMHERIKRRGPVQANNVIRSLSIIWNHGRKLDPSLPENPCAGMRLVDPEPTLNRPITDLAEWSKQVDGIESLVHRAAYRLALLTGMRRSEIEGLRWDEVDVGNDAHIHLPPDRNKSARDFYLPLVREHIALFDQVRGLNEVWVFPSKRAGSGHVANFRHGNVPGTLHSLRHTFATVGVEAGVPEEVIGRLMNHASKSITGSRYVRPNLGFLRAAMQVVVDELEKRTNA